MVEGITYVINKPWLFWVRFDSLGQNLTPLVKIWHLAKTLQNLCRKMSKKSQFSAVLHTARKKTLTMTFRYGGTWTKSSDQQKSNERKPTSMLQRLEQYFSCKCVTTAWWSSIFIRVKNDPFGTYWISPVYLTISGQRWWTHNPCNFWKLLLPHPNLQSHPTADLGTSKEDPVLFKRYFDYFWLIRLYKFRFWPRLWQLWNHARTEAQIYWNHA